MRFEALNGESTANDIASGALRLASQLYAPYQHTQRR